MYRKGLRFPTQPLSMTGHEGMKHGVRTCETRRSFGHARRCVTEVSTRNVQHSLAKRTLFFPCSRSGAEDQNLFRQLLLPSLKTLADIQGAQDSCLQAAGLGVNVLPALELGFGTTLSENAVSPKDFIQAAKVRAVGSSLSIIKTYIHMCVTYLDMFMSSHVCMYVCMYVCARVCMYERMSLCICMYVCMCVCMYVNVHIHACFCVCMQTPTIIASSKLPSLFGTL